MASGGQKVRFDIGGRKFTTLNGTLNNIPGTKLANLNHQDPSYNQAEDEYFFDRNSDIFASILEYYRVGELHIPVHICGRLVKKELDFWGINENVVSRCCWRKYKGYIEELGNISMVEMALNWQRDLRAACEVSGIKDSSIRRKIWLFLEDPQYSTTALVYSVVTFLLTIISVAFICLETDPLFRTPAQDALETNSTNARIVMFSQTDPHRILFLCDNVVNIIFTVDILLRLCSCPRRRVYVKSFPYIIDILCITVTWSYSIVVYLIAYRDAGILQFVIALGYLRTLRVIKLLNLAKYFRRFHILILTIKSSIPELLLLCAALSIGVVIFAVLIYFAEMFTDNSHFRTIPVGFWWSIVSMTTVGYGDTIPLTLQGYVVGSICAVCGLICTALPIPIIGSKFTRFYEISKIESPLKQAHDNYERRKSMKIRYQDAENNFISNDSHDSENVIITENETGNHTEMITAKADDVTASKDIKVQTISSGKNDKAVKELEDELESALMQCLLSPDRCDLKKIRDMRKKKQQMKQMMTNP